MQPLGPLRKIPKPEKDERPALVVPAILIGMVLMGIYLVCI